MHSAYLNSCDISPTVIDLQKWSESLGLLNGKQQSMYFDLPLANVHLP